jgi:hypothetical protein
VTAAPAQVAPGDTLAVGYTLTAPATVTATLVNASGQTLDTLLSTPKPAGSWTLDVTPPAGLADGAYTIAVTATSPAKTVSASAPFVLDDILTGLTVTRAGAAFTLTRPAQLVTAQIVNGPQLPALATAAGPQSVAWPPLQDGTYTLALTVTDDVGTFTRTTAFTVDTTPPKVTVRSYANLRFSVNEAATLTLVVGTARYTRMLKQPATTQFWLEPKPFAYTLIAVDTSGNRTVVRYRR